MLRRLVHACAFLLVLTALKSESPPANAQPVQETGPVLPQLEEAVRQDPDNADARHQLGMAFHQTGQLQRAIEEYQQAIRLSPTNVELYLGLADVFGTANLTDEAETLLVRTSEAFPDAISVKVELAEVRFAAGRVEEALPAFEAARRTADTADTDRAIDTRQRAYILRRIGDMHVHLIRFDEALTAYQGALVLAPEDIETHLALGKLYLRRNRMEDALAEYGIVLETDPGSLPAHEGIAEAHFRLDRFEEAIAYAETAIGIDAEHLGSRYLLATSLIRSGQDEAARLALDQYRSLEAEARVREQREREIGGIYKAALAEMLDGNGPEAVGLLRDGIDSHPDAGELYLNLGITLNSLGRYSEAVEVFENMVDSGIGNDALVGRSLAEARERRDSANQ